MYLYARRRIRHKIIFQLGQTNNILPCSYYMSSITLITGVYKNNTIVGVYNFTPMAGYCVSCAYLSSLL